MELVGDIEQIFNPKRTKQLSEKLLCRYYGPYKITKQTSNL